MSPLASVLDGFLTQQRVRFIGVAVLAVALALAAISFSTARNNRTVFGVPPGADYVAFYVVGTS